jgi:3-oxoacyl-[acyl-carrier protein] reductase
MAVLYTYPPGCVLVFGGSGGAGSDICRAFAAAGCDVAFTYHASHAAANALTAELQQSGVFVTAHQVDITDPDRCVDTLDAVVRSHGRVHTVVYACGPHIDVMPILDNTPERFRFMVEAELLGFFHIMKAARPHLADNGGSVVACVTYANRKVLHNDGQSAAPKAGIESLVRQIAKEEAGSGMRANAVALGWLNVGQGSLEATDRSNTQSDVGREMVEYMSSLVPLGQRPGRGEELAAAVLFFASQQASYITGQILTVDGGASL